MARGIRKFSFGFSTARTNDGKPLGHAIIKLKPRNAYELMGLRKPAAGAHGRA